MPDKPNSAHTFGLELDGTTIKAVKLSLKKGRPAFDRFFEIEVEEMQSYEAVNPLYMSDEGKQLCELARSTLVISVLDGQEVLVRPLTVKLKKEKDIEAVLAFQAEPLLPFPIENTVLDKMTISKSPDGTQLTLLIARKETLENHLNKWKALDLEPEAISCVPAALASFSKVFYAESDPIYVLHLGMVSTTCSLVRSGVLLASQTLPFGVTSLKNAYREDLADEKLPFQDLNFEGIEERLFPKLFASLNHLRRETTRLVYALGKQNKGEAVATMLVTGDGAALQMLPSALCQTLNLLLKPPVADLSNFPVDICVLQRLAVPIGSALSGFPNHQSQIDFRQQEFIYPHPWKRLKTSIAAYFALCFACALSFYLFGHAYLGYQEDMLKQDYVELLTSIKKSHTQFEKEYLSKFPSPTEDEIDNSTPKGFTSNDILARLNFLEKELQSTPETFPLQPNTPKVSDVLAWMSTHPLVVGNKDNTNPLTTPLLNIESFNYSLVKRPEQKKQSEKYQVKVELEFSTPTPKFAREFHDALIAPNEIVDPKGEVKWSSNRGKYRTSFYLKDKTVYPSTFKSAEGP